MHIPPAIANFLYPRIYAAICASLHLHEENRAVVDEFNAQGQRLIFCLWHDELFSLIPVARQLHIAAMVSPSKDGEMLERILRLKNVEAVHGSSTRGGLRALLTLAHRMKKELLHACITLDGPRGPRHRAKEGALLLARRTGAHIVPVRMLPRHAFHLPTWDRFQVPVPFTDVLIRFGKPWEEGTVAIPEDDFSSAAERLEKELEILGRDNL